MPVMQQQREALKTGEYDAATIAREIVDIAIDKKASDVTLLDIGKLTTLAEYFVMATATSERQINAVSRGVQDAMREQGIRLLRDEGPASDGWVLLDYGQVIVHIFSPEQREYYDLERRWQDAAKLVHIQ